MLCDNVDHAMSTKTPIPDGLSSAPAAGRFGLFRSPWLWGAAATWGVYAAIPHSGTWQPFWQRYLAGHPVEYAEVGLFLVGVAVLVFKALRLTYEKHAVAWTALTLSPPLDIATAIQRLQERLTELPASLYGTYAVQRLVNIADYLRDRNDADGLEAHAQLLTQQAADRQHDDYGQLQTLIWAVPILGFLGTVMGITLSIANITPDQLDTSLDSVTGGLAVAFDTTAVALIQSIVLVFGAFFIKRTETRLLAQIEEQVFKGLISPLSGAARSSSPIIEAESRAARELLTRTEELITQQTDLWRESVEGLRSRWSQTVATQQQELTAALSGGVTAALGDHTQLLEHVRQEFLAACGRFTQAASEQLAESRALQAEQHRQLLAAWQTAWGTIREQMDQDRAERAASTEELLSGFSRQTQSAVTQLSALTEALREHFAAVAQQTGLLTEIVGEERHLAGLQSRLTENLEALQAAETMQQSVHSLTAAIHLLTARARTAA